MSYAFERTVNYYETDRMGIVHHSNYIRYMEEARCGWMEALGIPMRVLEARGFTIPTLEVSCQYLHPVTAGDRLLIAPRIEFYNGVRMTVGYTMCVPDSGQEIARAQSKHCFTTLDLEPVNMKKHDPEVDGILREILAENGTESDR